jgi:hypothetical protein
LSFTQACCWAWENAKTSSGYSSASVATLETVRATLRRVSRSGQSQAESMCAWPTADSWCALDLPAARLLRGQLLLQAVERLQVQDQVPHLGVEHRQVGAGQLVDRGLAALGADVDLRVGVVERDLRVRGALDVELDPVARRGRRTVRSEDRQRRVGLPRVQTLQRYAGGGVHQALGGEAGAAAEAEVDHGLDLGAGPLGRHLAAELEPRGAPGGTPGQADLGRLERLGQGLGGGDRLTGCVPHLDVQRDGGAVDRGADPLPQGALEPLLDQLSVVVHEIILR